MFGDFPRKAPSPVKCSKCGAQMGTLQMLDFDKAPLLIRRGLMAMTAAVDTDININSISGGVIAEVLNVLCQTCTNG